jgi:hypothetical protein
MKLPIPREYHPLSQPDKPKIVNVQFKTKKYSPVVMLFYIEMWTLKEGHVSMHLLCIPGPDDNAGRHRQVGTGLQCEY